MLRVIVAVNRRTLFEIQAVRIEGGTSPDDINTYELDGGWSGEIKHRYGDGAEVLAEKMLAHLIKLKSESKHGDNRY